MMSKLAENMPSDLKTHLKLAGHDATDAIEEGLGGAPDESLVEAALSERRTLFTFDKDFANIRNYPTGSHAGIVVFRLEDQRWATLKQAVSNLLKSGLVERLESGLAVVNERQIRIRTRNL